MEDTMTRSEVESPGANAAKRRHLLYKRLDALGLSAAMLCAAHCALIPLLATLGALGGLVWLTNPWIEASFILFGLLMVVWSLRAGYLSHHGKEGPLAMAALAFVVIVAGRFFHGAAEHLLTAAGGLTLAGAHAFNWRLLRRCEACRVNRSRAAQLRLTLLVLTLGVAIGALVLAHAAEHRHVPPTEQEMLNMIWRPTAPPR
jgi:hypothetical protein